MENQQIECRIIYINNGTIEEGSPKTKLDIGYIDGEYFITAKGEKYLVKQTSSI